MKWCWIIDVSSLHLEVIVSSRLTFSVFMWPKQQVKLEEYGRPKIDGELKVSSIVNRTKQDRWVHTTENNHPTNMRNKVTCILTAVNCVCVCPGIYSCLIKWSLSARGKVTAMSSKKLSSCSRIKCPTTPWTTETWKRWEPSFYFASHFKKKGRWWNIPCNHYKCCPWAEQPCRW